MGMLSFMAQCVQFAGGCAFEWGRAYPFVNTGSSLSTGGPLTSYRALVEEAS